jgi:hypothetical protein
MHGVADYLQKHGAKCRTEVRVHMAETDAHHHDTPGGGGRCRSDRGGCLWS